MAFTEFYCQTTASNLNAGSSQADASEYTATNGDWNSGTGVFTPGSGDPSATVSVGDFASVYIDGASLAVFVARVTAVDSTTITISTTAKSGTAPSTSVTARTCKVGGAWKGPNGTSGFPFDFIERTCMSSSLEIPRVNLLTGVDYDITAAIVASQAGPLRFQGYTTTVGDGGRFIVDGGVSGASYELLQTAGQVYDVWDAIFTHNGATGSEDGVDINGIDCVWRRVVVHDVLGDGFAVNTQFLIECEAYNCGNRGFVGNMTLKRCSSHDNSGDGFATSTVNSYLMDCIAAGNTGIGFNLANWRQTLVLLNCDSYDNGSDGLKLADNSSGETAYIENCNFVKNGGYGVNVSDLTPDGQVVLVNCAFGAGTEANVSGQTNGLDKHQPPIGSITLPTNTNPWVDPANGDFTNNISQVQEAGRGDFGHVGWSADPVSSNDIGAVRHADPVGGGAASILGGGNLEGGFS